MTPGSPVRPTTSKRTSPGFDDLMLNVRPLGSKKRRGTLETLITSVLSPQLQENESPSVSVLGDALPLPHNSPLGGEATSHTSPSGDSLPTVVHRHRNTTRKYYDWVFPAITHPTLVIGSSNLSRIPVQSCGVPGVQIESFPGAKLEHLAHLFRMAPPDTAPPRNILLNIGLNNRSCLTKRNIPDLNRLYSDVRKKFPSSDV